MGRFGGRTKFLSGPDAARGPDFADPSDMSPFWSAAKVRTVESGYKNTRYNNISFYNNTFAFDQKVVVTLIHLI